MARRHLLTRTLWAGNAIAIATLLAVVLFRFGALMPGDAALPDLRPLRVAELAPPPLAQTPGERNPFDPSGMAWREPKDDEASAGSGELKGIIVLPGVRRAVTDRGSVGTGEALGAGRIVSIDDRAVVVDTGSGRKPLETPGVRRPRLQDLNRVGKLAPAPAEGRS